MMAHPQPRRYASQQQAHSPPPSYHAAPSTPDLPHADETTPLCTKPHRTSKTRAVFPILVLVQVALAIGVLVKTLQPSAPIEREIYWEVPLVADVSCLGYGTRAYAAQLHVEPPAPGEAWHKICVGEAPEVEITGRIVERPAWCDRDANGTVFGHWIVDYDEPECISNWAAFADKGCTADASGLRNYEARLFGRLEGGAWRDMCRRTPAIVHGQKFPGAMRCADRVEEGKWGAWDLEDETCA
ncbi:hypothetical protein BD626DRAFT_521233 [Schizophyllum amplum]|uniref:Uncharacterized protein n=1 Tax=Schizophyllum amplum TaxID=97359 RepID=A0A550BTU2_9AGAR|nr:hypothetical protein BD626DRAFT_521233 [Auriculariopsis ampla]